MRAPCTCEVYLLRRLTACPSRSDVLAMYPQTTTFYRARVRRALFRRCCVSHLPQVLSAPASRPKSRDYVLRFEDDDTDLRVAPHYVVAAPAE